MGGIARLIVRVLMAPLVFLAAGSIGAVAYVFMRQEKLDDERPKHHEITHVAPEETDDDRLRSYGKDVWAKDLSPHGRLVAVQNAQQRDSENVQPVESLDTWYERRKARRAALN